MVVSGEGPTVGEACGETQTQKGRGVRTSRATVNTGTPVTHAHRMFKCFYTNADSLITHFVNLKHRSKLVIACLWV